VKGTRLWQAPGSPIIQGRSRNLRAFWESWLAAALLSEVVAVVVSLGLLLWQPDPNVSITLQDAARAAAMSAALPAIPGALLGGAVGVWIARAMCWRRERLAGALVGAAIAMFIVALL